MGWLLKLLDAGWRLISGVQQSCTYRNDWEPMIERIGRSYQIRHAALSPHNRVTVPYTVDVLNLLYWWHVRNEPDMIDYDTRTRATEIMSRRASYKEGPMLAHDGSLASWTREILPEVRDTYHEIAQTSNPTTLLPASRLDHVLVKAQIDIVAIQLAAYMATANADPVPKDVQVARAFPQIVRDRLPVTTSQTSGFGQVPLDTLRKVRMGQYFDQLHRCGMVTMSEVVWRIGVPGRHPSYATLTPYARLLVDET